MNEQRKTVTIRSFLRSASLAIPLPLLLPGTRGVPGRIVSGFNFMNVTRDPAGRAWQWQDPES